MRSTLLPLWEWILQGQSTTLTSSLNMSATKSLEEVLRKGRQCLISIFGTSYRKYSWEQSLQCHLAIDTHGHWGSASRHIQPAMLNLLPSHGIVCPMPATGVCATKAYQETLGVVQATPTPALVGTLSLVESSVR